MKLDWRSALASPDVQLHLLLAETTEQLLRQVSRLPIVLYLLRTSRENSDLGREVVEFAETAIPGDADDETISHALMPLCCCAYVLSRLGLPGGFAVLEALATTNNPDLRWVPRFARLCLAKATASTVHSPFSAQVALELLPSVSASPGEAAKGVSREDETIESRAGDEPIRIAA